MSIVEQFGNYLFWAVTGTVTAMFESARRLRNKIVDIEDENKQQKRDMERVRKHVGLNEEYGGESRLDELEKEVEQISATLERHEVYWTGNPDDPNQKGALGDLYEIRQNLRNMKSGGEGRGDDDD